MTDYNAYGEMYDQRPELIIQERHKGSGKIRELAQMAHRLNYKVSYQHGIFRDDMIVAEYEQKPQPMNYSTAKRYFERQVEVSQ
ncbi:MAG: hypothetical protein P8Y72_01920 [Anaerolineales bacterium]|jgi:hypothetical protein